MAEQMPLTEKPDPGTEEGQIALLTQAFLWALMTGGEQPYPVPPHEVAKMASMAYRCGVRQTGEVAEEIELPGWVVEGAREQAAATMIPPEIDFGEPVSSPLIAELPAEPPKKIPQKQLGVIAD